MITEWSKEKEKGQNINSFEVNKIIYNLINAGQISWEENN